MSAIVWAGGQGFISGEDANGATDLRLADSDVWQWLAYVAAMIGLVPLLRILNNGIFLLVALGASSCRCFHFAFHMGALDGPVMIGALAGLHWAVWDATINRRIDRNMLQEGDNGTERLRNRIGTLLVLAALYRAGVGVLQRMVRGGVNVEGLAAKIEQLLRKMKAVRRFTAAAANAARERRLQRSTKQRSLLAPSSAKMDET